MKIGNVGRITMALVVVLLLAVLVRESREGDPLPTLISQLHAQTSQGNADVVFFPVGNQDVRKFVFWDRRANQIHIYSGGGKFEETWLVGAMGQDFKKQ